MTTLSTFIGSVGTSATLGEMDASPKPSFWQRLGGVFRKPRANVAAEIPTSELTKEGVDSNDSVDHAMVEDSVSDSVDESPGVSDGGPSLLPPNPPRRRLLWGRRETPLDEVRNGLGALASLLTGIQQHMEQQSVRQQELLGYLSHLPEASRVQSESLEAIRRQMEQGGTQQSRLCVALERLSGAQETTGTALSQIDRRIEKMDARDTTVTEHLVKVGSAMETVGRTSESGAAMLGRMHQALTDRESQLQSSMEKQQGRFTALMAVAVILSVSALTVAAGMGYLVLTKIH